MKTLIILFLFFGSNKPLICPKCGEAGCIYQQIEKRSNGSDTSNYRAILEVGKERGLNEKQVSLLFTEYKLN